MKIRTYTTGYSTELAKQYLNVDEEFVAVTQVVEIKKYDNESNKYTDEFSHLSIYFTQKNLTEPFRVKFENKKVKIEQFQKVKLKNLVCCEINRTLYFKADDVEVI